MRSNIALFRRFIDDRGYLINLAQAINYAVVTTAVLGAHVGSVVWMAITVSSTGLRWISVTRSSSVNPILSEGASFYIAGSFSLINAGSGFFAPLVGIGTWSSMVVGLSIASLIGAWISLRQGLQFFDDHRRRVGALTTPKVRAAAISHHVANEHWVLAILICQAFAAGMQSALIVYGSFAFALLKVFPPVQSKRNTHDGPREIYRPFSTAISNSRLAHPLYRPYLATLILTGMIVIGSIFSALSAPSRFQAVLYILFAVSRLVHMAGTDSAGRYLIRQAQANA